MVRLHGYVKLKQIESDSILNPLQKGFYGQIAVTAKFVENLHIGSI